MEKIKKEEPAKVAVQQPNAFNMISIVPFDCCCDCLCSWKKESLSESL